MNDHEAQRIAMAVNAARPDWPTNSLLTLIRKHLLDRPRRDVFVAFAWIASEPNTAKPARVLEAGPWWRAAAVDDAGTRPSSLTVGTAHGDPREVCGICDMRRDDCQRRHPVNGHEFFARIDCLPPTQVGPFGERGKCLAGPPERPCQLITGHQGQHEPSRVKALAEHQGGAA